MFTNDQILNVFKIGLIEKVEYGDNNRQESKITLRMSAYGTEKKESPFNKTGMTEGEAHVAIRYRVRLEKNQEGKLQVKEHASNKEDY